MKILVKLTNGKKTYIEDVTEQMMEANQDWEMDLDYFKPIKCNLGNIRELNGKSFIYGWIEGFMQCDDVPDWIWESEILDIEVMNEE